MLIPSSPGMSLAAVSPNGKRQALRRRQLPYAVVQAVLVPLAVLGCGVPPPTGSGGAGGNGGTGGEAQCPATSLTPGEHTFQVPSTNGTTYRVVMTVPRNYNPASPPPLGVVWHALSSSPEETRNLTDIDAQAEARGLVMAYPAAPDQQWNGGTCCFQSVRDDVTFARDLVKFVQSKVCVDRRRIYTAGFSNGGFMSYRLACEAADVFAAAAPIAGAFAYTTGSACKPSRPIPVMAINGTADPLVVYNGGGFPSAPNSFNWMAQADGCSGTPVTTFTQGAVSCQTYRQCGAGVEVSLCTANGMGHCMPGMKVESPTNCLTRVIPLGPPNNDINGVDFLIDFLSQWSLP